MRNLEDCAVRSFPCSNIAGTGVFQLQKKDEKHISCFVHVLRHFQCEMFIEWHSKFSLKQMNMNVATNFHIGCCMYRVNWEIKSPVTWC